MRKTKHGRINYCIHAFMIDELALSGGELLVFAVIYSFTKGERGLFFGTNDYLASISGVSLSTVKRALARLLEKGYVERSTAGQREGYCSTQRAEPKNCYFELDEPPNDAEDELPPMDVIIEEGMNENMLLGNLAQKPKYVFHSLGNEGIVNLTAEQYVRLSQLVDESKLYIYCLLLEKLILEKGYRCRNHYRTIKRWIYEDVAV